MLLLTLFAFTNRDNVRTSLYIHIIISTRIEDAKLEVERIRQKAKLHCDSPLKEFNRQLYQVSQLSNKNILFEHGKIMDKYKDIISEVKDVNGKTAP
jgi:hypothetical protein